MFQKLIGYAMLLAGAAYGILLLKRAAGEKEALRNEEGDVRVLSPALAVIYFITTLGLSDFLMMTLLIRGLRLMEDKKIPGTLVAASITPGALMACVLLQAKEPAGMKTLLLCSAAILIAGKLGARLVGRIDAARIRSVMGIALIGSLAALILKMIVSRLAAGTITELSGAGLVIAVITTFCWGILSMLGVPCKPAATAVFLLLGMSPVATLTLLLVLGCLGPLGGAMDIYRMRNYHQKMTCCSVTAGSVGAALGCLFALSVNPAVLNILMILMLAVAIAATFKK